MLIWCFHVLSGSAEAPARLGGKQNQFLNA